MKTKLFLICMVLLPLFSFGQYQANDDLDSDGIVNYLDADDDNDGILDCTENTTSYINEDLLGTTFYKNATMNYSPTNSNIGVNKIVDGGIVYNNGNSYTEINAGNTTTISPNLVITIPTTHAINEVTHFILYNDAGLPSNSIKDFQVIISTASGQQHTTTFSSSANVQNYALREVFAFPETYYNITQLQIKISTKVSSAVIQLTEVGLIGTSYCIPEDWDNDGIANHHDFDADNDGCPDAIEAQYSTFTVATLIGNGSINGAVETLASASNYGVPMAANNATGFAIGSAQNQTVISEECDACNTASSMYIDSDLDGISNFCDLDNDNDGILDCTENTASAVNEDLLGPSFFQSATMNYASQNENYTANNIIDAGIIYNEGNSYIELLSGTPEQIEPPLIITIPTTHPIEEVTHFILYNDAGLPSNSLVDFDVKITTRNGSIFTNSFTTSATNTNYEYRESFAFPTPYYQVIGVQVIAKSKTSVQPLHLTEVGLIGSSNCIPSDYDNDGILDFLDLDSDNDSCVDALEGSGNFTAEQLNENALSGTTDANGIPIIANGGQDLGTSKNADQQDETCITATPWECSSTFYQIHNNTSIVALDTENQIYNTVATITNASSISAIAYHPSNQMVYAIATQNDTNYLVTINPDGNINNLEYTLSNNYASAAITNDGVLFLIQESGVINAINLASLPYSSTETGITLPTNSKLVFDTVLNLIYSITASGQLYTINPTNYSVTSYALTGAITLENSEFSALWSSNNGSVFAYNATSGKIYSINTENLSTFEVRNSTSNSTINDGFNCASALPPLENNATDGIDNDGDGLTDCNDPDSDNNPNCLLEICDNGIDDDGDGLTDCEDSECYSTQLNCQEICDNGIDDNGNGLIDENDAQCTTSPSVEGGLESNRRLSTLIAKRNYKNAIQKSEEYLNKRNGTIPFSAVVSNSKTSTAFGIIDLIPNTIPGLLATEGTPSDLTNISNAIDVASADYYVNNQRIASVLGITSENSVYEHTKYICDRLDGSKLIDLSYINYGEGNVIQYELLNKENQREYAATLVGYIENNAFYLENHWNTYNYTPKPKYYNVQIWANSQSTLQTLLADVVERMRTEAPIASATNTLAPRTFISYGYYKNGVLYLHIKNKTRATALEFEGNLRRTETSALEYFTYTSPLTGAKEETIAVPTGYMYDFGFAMHSANNPNDELFMADGTWMADTSHNGIVLDNFTITAQEENILITNENHLLLERSISAQAQVRDYLNISRSITPKYSARDLSEYNSVAFTASGNGTVELTLVKEGIAQWENQFKVNFRLTETPQDFVFTLEDFISLQYSELALNDVVMVVFTLVGNGTNFVDRACSINQLRFTNLDTATPTLNTLETSLNEPKLNIYPNPATTTVTIASIKAIKTIELYAVTGQLVVHNTYEKERNKSTINLTSLNAGLYLLKITNYDGTTKVSKIVKQ